METLTPEKISFRRLAVLGETCKKCGTYYEDPSDGFYWEERKGYWRKPCKKCIARYNKRADQKTQRYAANEKYKQTEKGHESIERSKQAGQLKRTREKEVRKGN